MYRSLVNRSWESFLVLRTGSDPARPLRVMEARGAQEFAELARPLVTSKESFSAIRVLDEGDGGKCYVTMSRMQILEMLKEALR